MTREKEIIKQEIEKRRQLIWPTNTGEMKVVDTPNQLIQGWLNCLKWIEDFIDLLPEEPINFPHERNIVDKVFGAGNLESWEYEEAEKLVLLAKEELLKDLEINKEPASEELESIVEQIADPTIVKAYGVTELANRLRKSVLQMYASENLEEDSSFEKLLQEIYIKYDKKISIESLLDIVSHFAEWQKQQMKETLQTEYEKGRFDMREEMMKDAQLGIIEERADGLLGWNTVYGTDVDYRNYLLSHFKNGDKVKLIIIKEEQ